MYSQSIDYEMTIPERKELFNIWRKSGVKPQHVQYRSDPAREWDTSRAYSAFSRGDDALPCRFGEYRVYRSIVPPSSTIPPKSNPLDDILKEMEEADAINPKHYTSHPSGVECIKIIRHMPTCIAIAVKYLWRLDEKYNGTKDIEDLRKAIRWLEEEIDKRETQT